MHSPSFATHLCFAVVLRQPRDQLPTAALHGMCAIGAGHSAKHALAVSGVTLPTSVIQAAGERGGGTDKLSALCNKCLRYCRWRLHGFWHPRLNAVSWAAPHTQKDGDWEIRVTAARWCCLSVMKLICMRAQVQVFAWWNVIQKKQPIGNYALPS